MDEDENDISLFKERDISKKLVKSLIWTSKGGEENKKKKKKRWVSLLEILYNEDEEIGEHYNDVYYNVLVYPPNSILPSPDKKSLSPEFMKLNHLL